MADSKENYWEMLGVKGFNMFAGEETLLLKSQ